MLQRRVRFRASCGRIDARLARSVASQGRRRNTGIDRSHGHLATYLLVDLCAWQSRSGFFLFAGNGHGSSSPRLYSYLHHPLSCRRPYVDLDSHGQMDLENQVSTFLPRGRHCDADRNIRCVGGVRICSLFNHWPGYISVVWAPSLTIGHTFLPITFDYLAQNLTSSTSFIACETPDARSCPPGRARWRK
jgi:hypothetical protein